MKFDKENLHKLGAAGEFVMLVEPHTEADPMAILFQLLVAFGNSCGSNAHFSIEKSKHHMNLFTVLVGASARSRKGTSWDWVRNAFEEIDEDWFQQRIKSGLSSGEGLVWAVRDPITDEDENKTDSGILDKRLLVVETEFASVLKQTTRDGNILSPMLRDAWDGKSLQNLTKNQHASSTNPHISIIGHITNQELGRYLSETEMFNGFGNRFAWVSVGRTKIQAFSDPVSVRGWKVIVGKINEALVFSKSIGEITFAKEAIPFWEKMYIEIESKTFPGTLDHILARSSPMVLRFSAILALLDKSKTIEVRHLEGGKLLWDFCETSAIEIFQGAGDLVKKILKLINSNDVLSLTDLNAGLGRNYPKERIDECLAVLKDTQKISIKKELGANNRMITLISSTAIRTNLTNFQNTNEQ